MARRKPPVIPDALLDQLLAGSDAKSAFDPNGLLDGLKKALAGRALNAEMDHHLAGEDEAGNGRNGYGRKTVLTDTGKLELEIPRDRRATDRADGPLRQPAGRAAPLACAGCAAMEPGLGPAPVAPGDRARFAQGRGRAAHRVDPTGTGGGRKCRRLRPAGVRGGLSGAARDQ